MQRLFVWLSVVIIIAAGYVSILAFGVGQMRLGVTSALVGGVALCVYLKVYFRPDVDVDATAVGPPEPELVDWADLIKAEDHVVKQYDKDVLNQFVRYITDTRRFLSRVDESMELDGHVGRMRTSLTFRWLKEQVEPSSLLVPLVTLRKGFLFDGFAAYDSSGKSATTLSQLEVRGLLLVTLRSLFLSALTVKQGTQVDRLSPTDTHAMLQIAKDTICATAGRDRAISIRRTRDALARIANLDGDRFDEQVKADIRSFCLSLTNDYVLVVQIPAPGPVGFTVGYRNSIVASQTANKNPEHKKRVKHGLAPIVVDAPMSWALRPDSYHFELAAPAGQYVYDHHLEELESKNIVRQENFMLNGVQQYVRVYHKKARTIAHLYIRRVPYGSVRANTQRDNPAGDQGEPTAIPDFKSVVRLKEIPPGTLGNAVTVAMFTALVVTYFALFRDSGLKDVNPGSAGNFSALLLGFPAFLAAALGRGITSDGMRQTSLATFYGLWLSVLLSTAGVFLYLYDASRLKALNFELSLFGAVRHYNASWLVLSALSVGLYLILRKRKSNERRYYLDMMERAARI